jgi:hypothetical protein
MGRTHDHNGLNVLKRDFISQIINENEIII